MIQPVKVKPRSEPDSGNPTVRDRRGARGDMAMGVGLRPTTKAVEGPPNPNSACAADLSRLLPEGDIGQEPNTVRRL